jgi:SAM-dependent methyltransferase
MKQETVPSVPQSEPQLRKALESTARFYEGHAAEYFQRTVHADLSNIYDRFLTFVPTAGRILDAGCGSGRDLREFVQRGYRATGIDASRELVKLAERYSLAPCHVMRLEALSHTDCFDAIWACASLLHLPKSMLDGVLRRFATALVPHGVMFASVQIGEGESLGPDGRLFAYYAKPEFAGALAEAGFEPLDVWISEDMLPGRERVSWVNVIARGTKSTLATDE